jgi:hypothetical protein
MKKHAEYDERKEGGFGLGWAHKARKGKLLPY